MRGALAPALMAVVALGCTATAPEPTPSASESETPDALASLAPSADPSRETGWREITPPDGPAAREDHTWTVDADGTTAYLFGGRDGTTLYDDLWAFDLATDAWRRIDARGPAARFGHNAAWVDGVGLVVFAGQGAAIFFNDLWAYDPDAGAWHELPGGGAAPVPRYGSCAAVGPDGRLWISHGFTSEGARFADTRAYDFEIEAWTDETPVGDRPIERCLHGCWWSAEAFNLYGGQTTGTTALGDWWQLSIGPRPGTNAWAPVTIGGDGLPARNLYALTAFRGGHLVFGGQRADGGYLGDGWLIDHEGAPAPIRLGSTTPAPRAGAELITDAAADRVLLFGGRATDRFADLWELTAP